MLALIHSRISFWGCLCCLIILTSCSNSNQTAFTINGVAKNAKNKTISLLSFGEDSNTAILLDSCVVDSLGKYTLSTLSNFQELYAVQLDSNHLYWVINDSKNIHLNIEFNKPKNYEVSNSVNSTLLANFSSQLDSLYINWQTKKTIQDSVVQKKVSDSLKVVVKGETTLALQKLQALINKTIINNESVALKQFCIYYGFKLNIIDILSAYNYTQTLYNEYKQNPQVVVLYNQILEATKGNAEFLLSGKPAPNFISKAITGDTINLQKCKGNYVLLDFWDTKNKLYNQQIPALVELYKQYKDTNFKFIAISLDSSNLVLQKAIRRDSLKWKHIHDTLGLQGNFAKQYLVNNLPARYFINEEGKIIAINPSIQQLREKLKEIYKKE